MIWTIFHTLCGESYSFQQMQMLLENVNTYNYNYRFTFSIRMSKEWDGLRSMPDIVSTSFLVSKCFEEAVPGLK